MNFRLFKAFRFLSILMVVVLAACQVNDMTAVVTVQSTGSAPTPTAKKNTVNKAPSPLDTPTVVPTATIPAHLSAKPGQFNALVLQFWHPWTGPVASKTAELVNEFNRSNQWGIKVDVSSYYSAGALYEAVTSGFAHEPVNLPHVIAAPEDQLAEWTAEKDVIVPLDDYLVLPEIGFSKQELKGYNTAFWKQNQVNNHQVGIPVLRSANVIFYNQTWAKELGFQSPPRTPEEFKEQACAAAVNNNSAKILEKYGTGGWLVDTDSLTILSWLYAFDSYPLPSKEGQGYSFDGNEGQKAMAFLRNMLDDGCAWLRRSQTPDDYFVKRMALFYSGNLPDMLVQKRVNEISKSQDEWIVFAYPREDGSGVIFSNGYSLAVFNGSGIQSDFGEKDYQIAAWLFVRWLSQPVNLAKLAEQLPSLPVSTDVEAELRKSENRFPWIDILQLSKYTQPAPAGSSWRSVRRLVEDAGWQIFHLPADQVGSILPMLDESVKEILK